MKKLNRKSIIIYSSMAILFLICLKMITTNSHATTIPDSADAIVGKWRSEAQDSEMEIYKTGNTYSAKLLAGWGKGVLYEADGTLKKDTKNPDATLRNQPLLNLEFLTDVSYENGEYKGGNLYVVTIGKTLKCKMKFEENKLVLRMYAGIPLFGVTKKWTRFE